MTGSSIWYCYPWNHVKIYQAKGRRVEQCFYTRTLILWKASPWWKNGTIGCVFDKEHPGSLSIADTEDSVTALSTATLASEKPSTLHKKDKRALRKRTQQFACTDDGNLYYIGGASSKSLHVISSDNCDWLFAVLYIAEWDTSTLRRLVVEDHEQRKPIVATVMIPIQITLIAGSVPLFLYTVLFLFSFLVRCTCTLFLIGQHTPHS